MDPVLTPVPRSGELAPPRARAQRSSCAQRGTDRLGWRDVARLLVLPKRTAQRRLVEWATAPDGTAPRTELTPPQGRRGRSAYTTTRAEIARHYPEIDDDG